MSHARTHVQQLASLRDMNVGGGMAEFRFRSYDHLLLHYGKEFAGLASAEEHARYIEDVNPVPNACQMNAYKLAQHHEGDLHYCEGYATGVIPVPHAWCINAAGQIVDITWHRFLDLRDTPPDYFGLCFLPDFVEDTLSQQSYYGMLLDLMDDDSVQWEWLRHGLPDNALHPNIHPLLP